MGASRYRSGRSQARLRPWPGPDRRRRVWSRCIEGSPVVGCRRSAPRPPPPCPRAGPVVAWARPCSRLPRRRGGDGAREDSRAGRDVPSRTRRPSRPSLARTRHPEPGRVGRAGAGRCGLGAKVTGASAQLRRGPRVTLSALSRRGLSETRPGRTPTARTPPVRRINAGLRGFTPTGWAPATATGDPRRPPGRAPGGRSGRGEPRGGTRGAVPRRRNWRQKGKPDTTSACDASGTTAAPWKEHGNGHK